MSNVTSVTKEVTFDCAHMLSGHQALCKNLHGHTYKVQVTVTGTQISAGSSAKMVIDFKHLKRAITEVITNKFDHAVIFSSKEFRNEAEEELFAWAVKHDLRMFEMPTRTTAESMANYFQSEIFSLFESIELDNVHEVHVKVYETPTSYAEV